MKNIEFIGSSLDDLKAFPLKAKREFGYQLDRVQRGLDPSDWKPMISIGQGVKEIRVKDESGIFRVVYIAKFHESIFVLHSFQKKSQKTAKKDIDTSKNRLQEVFARMKK